MEFYSIDLQNGQVRSHSYVRFIMLSQNGYFTRVVRSNDRRMFYKFACAVVVAFNK